jgi:NAD(P)-dependent dehydrogenase (short-subunit alcohol dehydrogenase family)
VKVALVTGGGRGVGKVIARALVAAGHRVALVARTTEELEQTAAELGNAIAVSADVTDSALVEAAVATTESALGPIDLLVNNAGTARAIGPVWEVDPAQWWTDVESSLRSAFLCTRAVVPGMIDRGAGRILNVSSYVAARPTPYLSGYAAGKAAIVSFGEGLAASVREHGVSVFTITPGRFRSALFDHLLESDEGRRWLPELASGDYVDPERVERLVAFLASGRGDALSGRFLHALDDVEELAARAGEVAAQDLYTVRLRR